MKLILSLILVISAGASALAQEAKQYEFETQRRINAHGDEFMALALTKDERHLIIGAESGKLIVWGIAERRILKQLDQGSPVHCVVALNDSDTFIAAGGVHQAEKDRATVRKWRISTEASEEWQGLTGGTVVNVGFDPKSELLVTGDAKGHVAVWNSTNGQIIARRTVDGIVSGLALNGRELYLTVVPPPPQETRFPILRLRLDAPGPPETNFTTTTARYWAGPEVSPDRRFIAVRFITDIGRGVILFDLSTGKEISRFEAENFAWSTNGQLVLFDPEVAIARVSIDASGQISQSKGLDGAKFHESGSPANMTGQVVSKDGSRVWEVFQLGATLVELDIDNKRFDVLYELYGQLYALHVNGKIGLIATGGDDEFVRVRKLSDLSLVAEFKVELGVPQGVALMEDGRHVIFSSGDTNTLSRIGIGDVVTGKTRTLFELPEPFVRVEAAAGGFVYQRAHNLVLAEGFNGTTLREYAVEGVNAFAVSANGRWLVAENKAGKLFRFDVKSGKRTIVGRQNIEDLTTLTITNDGRYVYTTEFRAKLRRWDTKSGAMKELRSITGQAQTLKLSRDEREIIMGGNHRDVAIFDSASGEERLYLQVTASDFDVTNVWLAGDRLLFSTDAGVLFDGVVKR